MDQQQLGTCFVHPDSPAPFAHQEGNQVFAVEGTVVRRMAESPHLTTATGCAEQ
jgi:hypothetical protein